MIKTAGDVPVLRSWDTKKSQIYARLWVAHFLIDQQKQEVDLVQVHIQN